MAEYKLVPYHPTPEMVEAAEDAYMPFGDMELAIRMALLAAPAVQAEPVAWQLRTQDERLLRSAANSLRGYALELMLSHTLENGEWPDGEEDAKAHHDHMMALAKGLEELQAARTEAVQGEPVAWSGWGCQYPGKMPRLYGDRRIAELNCDTENGDQVLYFTAASGERKQ